MTAIFGVSAITVYFFFYENRSQQLNSQLLTLVQAAAPSIETVKTRGSKSLDKDLPWHDLFSNKEQSLEWFTANGKLLAKEGTYFPTIPLAKHLTSSSHVSTPVVESQGHLRIMTIAVYTNTPDKTTLQLQGYLRVSQSNQRFEASLGQLRLGLILGGIIALMLASISSLYLTQQAVKPMRLSFQRLTRFAADASHELRNPLTRIGIATEIMLSHPEQLKPADVKKLETITLATEQMRCLIDDVLFLARTDATYPPSKQEESSINLDQLLETLVERFKPQAHVKGIDFREQFLPDLFVKGSSTPLDRLFSNLLENALKYTNPGGKIVVSMQKSRQSVVVSVEDTGIGIPSEYAPFIFQRFWRADQARSQEQDGFGLGLAIAQTIAKQHHGEITVSSQVGVGSRFQVRLPLA
ncbi:MAG: HAMP domain-containing histidine kinase [Leptolyngbyaceae cyanobacterium CSU_1_3]|nr:HAMP domain-containing histidine kinase [Leptolyngbyaceae cyanobacterium CSU_1_3]